MDGKSWTIVKFKKENTVEAVPSSWLLQDKCYWPPFSNKEKTMKMITKNEDPNTCWPLYDVEIFRNSTFDDYITARRKASKAEDTSDLNSDLEAVSKRKIYRRRLSSSEVEYETGLPSPPQIDILEINEKESIRSYNPLRNSISGNLKQSVPATTSNCICCPIHRTEFEGYLEEIIKKQSLLRAQVKQLSDDIQGLQSNLAVCRDNASSSDTETAHLFQMYNFPLKDEKVVQDVEVYLSQEKNFNRAVKELAKVGGNSTYEFVKRTMAEIMEDNLAQKYSWYGAKKKLIFGKLKIAELLQVAAQKTLNVTNKETEEAVKKWLRRAKERAEKQSRR